MGNLKEKLMEVQSGLKAPKGQFNSFGKYKYRSCEDVLEALKPLLKKQGLILIITDDIKMIGDRFYIQANVTLSDTETGDVLNCSAFAREEESKKGMDGSQVTGAASSYARKYALNGMFCIDDNKDFDDPANDQNKAKKMEQQPQQTTDKPRLPILTVEGVKDWNIMLNMFYTSESDAKAAGKSFSLKNYIDSIRQCDNDTFNEISKRYIAFKKENGFK